MGKKVARVIGYVFCGIMLAVCIFFAFVSWAFTAEETVGVFGVNIYVANGENLTGVPDKSAVIVFSCEPYEISEGKLLLYKNGGKLSLGYGKSYSVNNGVYSINVIENDKELIIAGEDLVGKAEYSSRIIGKIILFVKSPFGVLCIAIAPCLVLIIFDIIRASVSKRHADIAPEKEQILIDKEALNEKLTPVLTANTQSNDGVLFSYTAKQKKSENKTEDNAPKTSKRNAGALPPALSDNGTAKSDQAFFSLTSSSEELKSAYLRSIVKKPSDGIKALPKAVEAEVKANIEAPKNSEEKEIENKEVKAKDIEVKNTEIKDDIEAKNIEVKRSETPNNDEAITKTPKTSDIIDDLLGVKRSKVDEIISELENKNKKE